MYGLPIFAIVIITVVIVILAVGGFYAYRRQQHRFRRIYGIDPKGGTEGSVKGVVRQVLRGLVYYREKLVAQLEFDNQWASRAIDTEASLLVYHDADQTRRQLLKQNTDIGDAVTAAGNFDHDDVVKELDLQQHLPTQGY